jgi:hypothetical protein
VDEIVIILPGTNIDAEPDRHFKLESASDLPVVLGLYPSGDPTVEIDLSARAQWLGEVVVEERRQTGFVPGRIERLTIDLISPCHDVTCPSDQVCDHNLGTCVDSDGGAPPVDGGDADGATGP